MSRNTYILNKKLIKTLVALGFLLTMLLIVYTPYLALDLKALNQSMDLQWRTNSVQKWQESKNVLAFSFYGTGSYSWMRYGKHVANVAKEAMENKFYQNWTVRIYHDNFPLELQKHLSNQYKNLFFKDVKEMKMLNLNLIGVNVSTILDINAMLWRFMPMGDLNVDTMCSRDLDSSLSEREGMAVKHWLDSGRIMHLMRDHPYHNTPILGGLWCFKNSKDRNKGQTILKILLDKAQKRHSGKEASRGDDQNILALYMWPLVRDDAIQHDSFSCRKFPGSMPFPSKRSGGYFAGCMRPCNGKPIICPNACRPVQHQNWDFC